MKRILFLTLVMAVFCIGIVHAQQTADKRLYGVWQQEQTARDNNGKQRIIHLPVWKVIEGNGTFYTFLIAGRDGRSMKMNEGTWTGVSDSIITEHVNRSLTAPQLNGCDNTIRYHFVDTNLIKIVYRLPNATRDAHETWRRVTMELP